MTKAEKANANMQWVRLRVALQGWTEEIEREVTSAIEYYKSADRKKDE